MRLLRFSLVLATLIVSIQGRILFPEEFVSFLSFVYSILPPIKVGHDSRFGAGFRVGPNADFQVLVELGPQSETQPLGVDSRRDSRSQPHNNTKPTTYPKTYNKRTHKKFLKNLTDNNPSQRINETFNDN